MRLLAVAFALLWMGVSAEADERLIMVQNRTSFLIAYVEAFSLADPNQTGKIFDRHEIFEGDRQIFSIQDVDDECEYMIVVHMHDTATYHYLMNICQQRILPVTDDDLQREQERLTTMSDLGVSVRTGPPAPKQ